MQIQTVPISKPKYNVSIDADAIRFYVTEQLSENIAETPEGFLLCSNVPITRIGEFIYKEDEVPIEADDSGIVRINREEEEVFSKEAIKSFEGKPFTINHPNEAVTPENWSEYANGQAQNIRRGEGDQKDLLIADILVTTEKAIELVKSGLREISCGYDAQYEQIEKGLGRQHEIIGNHVALVVKGRAGNRCAINDKTCDGCGDCKCGKTKQLDCNEEDNMSLKKKLKKWFDSFPVKDEDLEELEGEKKEAKDQAENLPLQIKNIKDTYDKWIKDAENGKLDVSNLPVELKNVADQEEEEEDKTKDQDEKLDKKIEDAIKRFKDQAKEDEDKTEDQDEEEEKKTEDQGGDVESRLASIEKVISQLLQSEEEVADAFSKKIKDEDEEEEEEAKAVNDSWNDLTHRAEILYPGMRLAKPTKDHAKKIREIKVDALKLAYKRPETRDAVSVFVKDGDFSRLKNKALDLAFVGASEIVARANNGKVQKGTLDMKTLNVVGAIADINKKNKDFYKR